MDIDGLGQIFIDNGGVITDNSVLARHYWAYVGEFLAPKLGGSPEAWGEANRTAFPAVRARSVARLEAWDETADDIAREVHLYNIDWLRSMATAAGVEAPAAGDDCAVLAAEANEWIITNAGASFPGAIDALGELSEQFVLFTASEGPSFQLAATFEALGVRHLFERLYGPDYVNTPKQRASYYERIFVHAGIDPAAAVVVDDAPLALRWARAAGARTVLVAAGPVHQAEFDAVIASLADLPAILSRQQGP